MSLLNKASLIQIPSGYKDGTLYSAKPTNGDGDFTFSRGSNLAATRVNSEGLIEKGRENIVLYSEDFNQANWVKNSLINVSYNNTDPNGGTTALKAESSGNAYIYQDITTTIGNVYVWSFYAKSDTPTSVDIRVDSSREAISLTTEWQRFSKFFVASSGTTRLWMGAGFSWSAGEIAYIAFAQCNLGTVATDYIETGASTAQAGILEDMPRLDYSGGASCPSLLLEPSRTNGVTQSEYFDDWNKDNISLILNDSSSPEGLQNAHKITENTSTGRHGIYKVNTGLSSNVSTTFSFFVKQGTSGQYAQCSFNSNIADYWVAALIDLSNGNIVDTASSVNATYENSSVIDFNNGWYRITLTGKFVTTEYHTKILISNTDSPTRDSFGNINYTGDGARNIYAYGAMLEEGSYPTSYIPTYGASVTRSADAASDSNVTPTSNKATLYIEINGNDDSENRNVCGFRNGATNQYVLYFWGADNNKFGFNSWAGDSYGITNSTIFNGDLHKIAAVFDFTDFTQNVLFIDGVKQSISQVKGTTVQRTASKVSLIAPNSNQNPIQNIHKFISFDSALTDAECIELTTL